MNSTRIFPVIMAGGASSRLWPASGKDRPKWDLRLGKTGADGKAQSLLENAWERARAVAPAADCFVVTAEAQSELVRQSLHDIPQQNVLIEPEPRDTAGAVAYAAGTILRQMQTDKQSTAVMLVLPGDHLISPVSRFTDCVHTAVQAAHAVNALVTFGIVPRHAATGYGYIHRGEALTMKSSNKNSTGAFRVQQFKEKPDAATAQKYVDSGEYYWNGGIFVWQLATLVEELQLQLPGHAGMVKELGAVPQGLQAQWDDAVSKHFHLLKKISIDFGIMEHAQRVVVVPCDFSWDDIGSWSAIAPHLPRVADNAAAAGTDLLTVDARGNVVFAPGKRVALIGVENLAVIERNGEILICRLDRDQDVKKACELAAKTARTPPV
jgi:mannose-1-phosphate guanylyltransferase